MKSYGAIFLILFSLEALALSCKVSGNYRCYDGRNGVVSGRGQDEEIAKENAREQARNICQGSLEYLRFIPSTSTCN